VNAKSNAAGARSTRSAGAGPSSAAHTSLASAAAGLLRKSGDATARPPLAVPSAPSSSPSEQHGDNDDISPAAQKREAHISLRRKAAEADRRHREMLRSRAKK
jgi:hypothetical protein